MSMFGDTRATFEVDQFNTEGIFKVEVHLFELELAFGGRTEKVRELVADLNSLNCVEREPIWRAMAVAAEQAVIDAAEWQERVARAHPRKGGWW